MKKKLPSWLVRLLWVTWILALIIAGEIACQVAYRIHKGNWYFIDRSTSARGLVQPHPYFGASMKPGARAESGGVRISINSFRCRGPEFARPKPAGRIRIVALGGSTTFGTGVSDDETWVHFLGQQLGGGYEVINMANPGGTSLEAMAQTAMLFSDVQPDIALYYLGWNDARVQHVKDLWPDWSDFHGRWVMAFGLSGRELSEPLASGYLMKRFLFNRFFPQMDPDKTLAHVEGTGDRLTGRIDPRALGHYERNVRNIIALCREQGVRPVFIPQVMNYRVLTSDKPYGFLPFVRDKHLEQVIGAYNQALGRIAAKQEAGFAGEALQHPFGPEDFLDQGHFTKAGNARFAEILAGSLRRTVSAASSAAAP